MDAQVKAMGAVEGGEGRMGGGEGSGWSGGTRGRGGSKAMGRGVAAVAARTNRVLALEPMRLEALVRRRRAASRHAALGLLPHKSHGGAARRDGHARHARERGGHSAGSAICRSVGAGGTCRCAAMHQSSLRSEGGAVGGGGRRGRGGGCHHLSLLCDLGVLRRHGRRDLLLRCGGLLHLHLRLHPRLHLRGHHLLRHHHLVRRELLLLLRGIGLHRCRAHLCASAGHAH